MMHFNRVHFVSASLRHISRKTVSILELLGSILDLFWIYSGSILELLGVCRLSARHWYLHSAPLLHGRSFFLAFLYMYVLTVFAPLAQG